MLPEMR